MAKKDTIRCPHCNYEYLPAEIFIPNSMLGYPVEIIRDESGNILGHQGSTMDLKETYCCDKCDKQFEIEASISFKTAAINDIFDVDDDFKDIIKKK